MLRTPLFDEHQALGAAFTDFGGWEMPVRYGSDLEEHHAVRNSAGLFDISHMGEIRIKGEAAELLDYALVSKLSAMKNGKAKYTMICNADGKVIDDLIVYRIEEDEYLVVANAGNRHAVLVQLLDAAEHFDVEVRDESDQWVLLALQGPKATAVLNEFVDIDLDPLSYYSIASGKIAQTEVLLARTGYTGEDGFEIFIPDNEALPIFEELAAREEVRVCGLAARDTLRLEAGMPLYGHELTLDVNPYEANLGRVVAGDKGDFVGKVALEGLKEQNTWRLYGLRGEGRRAARAEYEIYLPGGENPIGQVTSGALSPTLGYPVAMAYLDGSLELEIGSKLEADVRGTRVDYEVVELPFYRR